jgi:glycerol kinase
VSGVGVLAIDQGTTNTKALFIDRSGAILASASRPVGIRYPAPGWVEQDARELWRSVQEASAECLARAGAVKPAAIGISNQRESVTVWDRATGEPVGPCITWQCRRTATFCAELQRRGAAEFVSERSGLTLDPLFSASKARWLLDRASAGDLCIGTVDSWLLWNLTGGAVHATDLTNASRTQLLNLAEAAWDDELLRCFGIPRAALPAVHASSHLYGETADGVPIAALIGDSHAALFGHAIFDAGPVKATYGTGSSLMTIAEGQARTANGLSRTIGWSAAGATRYALEGNISNTGGAVQWVGDFLGLANPAEDAAQLAATVADSGGVYLVPAFVGLGAPHWDASARGILTGLTRGTTAGHAARAAVEAIGFQVRDVFEAMVRDLGHELPSLLADGGASRNESLMQFQADILGRPVVRSESADVSAIGAAWLAGLAVGFWKSLDELAALPRATRRFEPRMQDTERAHRYDGWREAVGRALNRTDAWRA